MTPWQRWWGRVFIHVEHPAPCIERETHTSFCWEWLGARDKDGYGVFSITPERQVKAHRFLLDLIDAIPEGMQVDHLCRNRLCVNPAHLEVVTPAENVRRSDHVSKRLAARTHCPNGHEFTSANTITNHGRGRRCRACFNESQRARRARGKGY